MLIGLVGFAGSGKGTAGDYLVAKHGYETDSFARTLKDVLAVMFDWDRELLEGNTPDGRVWRETVDEWWAKTLDIPDFTPRKAMQLAGTEALRHGFCDQMWIHTLARRYDPSKNIVVTDCRFPNELKLIRDLGGIVIRVKRGVEPEWFDDAEKHNIACQKPGVQSVPVSLWTIHISEWAWIGSEIDYTIENDGDVSDLHKKVEDILNEVVGI